MADQQHTEAPDCISMGGAANLLTLTGKSGMAAMTGTIDGAAYGESTSDLNSVGNGRFEYTMCHLFLDEDGSWLRTHDQAVLQTSSEGGASILEVAYTVVEATGRFAGHGGTFRSRGWLSTPEGEDAIDRHAVGIVRFEGKICRP